MLRSLHQFLTDEESGDAAGAAPAMPRRPADERERFPLLRSIDNGRPRGPLRKDARSRLTEAQPSVEHASARASSFPFENLVLEGGGAKGSIYPVRCAVDSRKTCARRRAVVKGRSGRVGVHCRPRASHRRTHAPVPALHERL